MKLSLTLLNSIAVPLTVTDLTFQRATGVIIRYTTSPELNVYTLASLSAPSISPFSEPCALVRYVEIFWLPVFPKLSEYAFLTVTSMVRASNIALYSPLVLSLSLNDNVMCFPSSSLVSSPNIYPLGNSVVIYL